MEKIRLVLVVAVWLWPPLAPAHDALRPTMVSAPISIDSDVSRGHAAFTSSPVARQPSAANFLAEIPSRDARRLADWVMASDDNTDLPFVIVDKVRAKVFVFDNGGRLRGTTFALLGAARGDDSVPGIGTRKLSTIRPEERTTPAGRFVAVLGRDFEKDILWIDYGASISLHRVITGNPNDHRLQRLATTSPLDKRITYGCVNVPKKFYEDVVVKMFTGTTGIVYILPEIKALGDVFSISKSAHGEVGKDVVESR